MNEAVKDKNVLFITTKNTDYLRNVQEVTLLEHSARSVTVLGYADKSYIKRLVKIYFKLLFLSMAAYDCVFVGFAPQLILPLFSFKLRKKTVVMDFFISVYDTMVFDRKKFKDGSFCAKLCKWLDTKCIRCADAVISDTKAHGDYFSSEFGVPRDKITTLYLEADTSIYYKRSDKKPVELQDKFVVLYFGSVLPLQGYEVILEAMALLKDHNDLFFYFIGPIKNKAVAVQSDNIRYIEWLGQEDLATHIGYADLCLAGHFHATIAKARRTIPGKAYIYEAMGKPMILGENPATHELYSEDEMHCFVEMGDAKALADKILEMKEKMSKCRVLDD